MGVWYTALQAGKQRAFFDRAAIAWDGRDMERRLTHSYNAQLDEIWNASSMQHNSLTAAAVASVWVMRDWCFSNKPSGELQAFFRRHFSNVTFIQGTVLEIPTLKLAKVRCTYCHFFRPTQTALRWLLLCRRGCLCVCHVDVLCPNNWVDHHETLGDCSPVILVYPYQIWTR